MKKIKQIIVIVPLLLSVAVMGAGGDSSGSDSVADTYKYTCQACMQIPPPLKTCLSSTESITFCGSEAWVHNYNPDCKRFLSHTRTCSNGGTQVWTDSIWSGAGSDCSASGSEHDCY